MAAGVLVGIPAPDLCGGRILLVGEGGTTEIASGDWLFGVSPGADRIAFLATSRGADGVCSESELVVHNLGTDEDSRLPWRSDEAASILGWTDESTVLAGSSCGGEEVGYCRLDLVNVSTGEVVMLTEAPGQGWNQVAALPGGALILRPDGDYRDPSAPTEVVRITPEGERVVRRLAHNAARIDVDASGQFLLWRDAFDDTVYGAPVDETAGSPTALGSGALAISW